MAKIAFKNGELFIDSEQDGLAVSIKPTDDLTKLWGNAGGFNYSLPIGEVTSCTVVRNSATDKIWVDPRVTIPITYLDRAETGTTYAAAVLQLSQKVLP